MSVSVANSKNTSGWFTRYASRFAVGVVPNWESDWPWFIESTIDDSTESNM
jgi:hypothetical protein